MTSPLSPPSATPLPRSALLAGLGIAIGGAVLFSTKAVVAKLLYRYHIDAITLIAFRMLFSLPVFAGVALWKMRTEAPLSSRDRWRIAGLGLLGYYLSSTLDFLGLQYISVGLERLILFLTPTFVLAITAVFFRRRIALAEWCALALSYCGIALVFLHDLAGGGNTLLGALFVLGSAVSYAFYLLGTGEMVRRIGSLRLVAYAMCVSSAACLVQFFALRPASLLVQQPLPVFGLSLVNGLFCTIFPVFMTMAAVQRIGAPTASQAGMVGPVSTLFLGALFLGEPVTAIQLAGTALVLAGITMLSLKK